MNEARQNLLVGIFVLAGLAALGTLAVLFGRTPAEMLGGAGYVLHVNFDSAGGIREGNPVTLNGLEIGRVIEVGFASMEDFTRGVRVTLLINREYEGKIPRGSRAITSKPGLGMGRPPIEIIPGPPTMGMLRPGDQIPGELRDVITSFIPDDLRFTFQRTANRIDEAAAALTPVLKDLHEILVKRTPEEVDRVGGPPGNLASAMARLDSSLKHFNDVLGDPTSKSQLKEAIANLHSITEDGKAAAASLRAGSDEAREVIREAKTLVSNARGTVERLDQEITAVSRDARDTLERGSLLMDTLIDITGSINRGEGTLGRLVRDSKLFDALVFTFEKAGQALEEFRILVKDWQKGKVRVAF
jgi:phospholipid/cholesterol/gamma-HCH transport system substrate-binding protein